MGLFTRNSSAKLNWEQVKEVKQLQSIFQSEEDEYLLFFKHSTRCSISSMMLNRFEAEWKLDLSACQLLFIDLVAHREVSNFLSEWTGVVHQSPQVILVHKGKVLYHASHSSIDADEAQRIVKENK